MNSLEKLNNSVAFLNNQDPDWVNKIDLEELNMVNNCILDQVFGCWDRAIVKFPFLNNQEYLFGCSSHDLWVNKIKELRGDLISG